ncbi:MAG: hypothetical protein ACYC4L_14170 [Chloroflexota bacterium]
MASRESGGATARRPMTRKLQSFWPALLLSCLLLLTACPGTPAAPAATATAKVAAAGTGTTGASGWAVTPVVPGVTPSLATPLPTAIPTPTATSLPKASPTAAPPPSPGDAILAKVVAVRGLALKQPVASSFLPREQLRDYLTKLMLDEEAQEGLSRDRGLYVNFGLIQPQADLQEIWLGLLDEQIAGLYNLDSKEMKIIGTAGGPISTGDELTLAHEYVHALQDQNFAAGEKNKEMRGDQDRAVAFQALVEGDATLAQVMYATQYLSKEQLAQWQREAGAADSAKYDAAPAIIRAGLLFPYEQGAAFVSGLFKSGGWAAVNKAFANPPQSSEQLLHPEKYTAGESPVRVSLPDLAPTLGAAWQSRGTDTFGEFGWLVYLASKLPEKQARDGGAGWGGDRYAVFENKGQFATVALTTWDSEAEARQFFQAVRDLYRLRTGQAAPTEATRITWNDSGGRGLASWRGTAVLLVVSPDDATTQKLAKAIPGF